MALVAHLVERHPVPDPGDRSSRQTHGAKRDDQALSHHDAGGQDQDEEHKPHVMPEAACQNLGVQRCIDSVR